MPLSNASNEIIKQIAIALNGAGYPNLLAAYNGFPPIGFDINAGRAPIDGWLRPATEPLATSFQLGTATYTGGGGWQQVASSIWTPTPYCPRPMLLSAALSGFWSTVGIQFDYRVKFGGTAVASGTFGPNGLAFTSLPPLMAVVTPAYPLVPTQIAFEVNPDTGLNFITTGACVASYSLH